MNAPTLAELVRVVGVGKSQLIDGVTISLLAVEVYEDGFAIPLVIRAAAGRDFALAQIPEYEDAARLELQVTDDAGNTYSAWPWGVAGSDAEQRCQVALTPPLPQSARALNVRIEEVVLRRHSKSQDRKVSEIRWRGPWLFTIDL
jgi:hypothetical protein